MRPMARQPKWVGEPGRWLPYHSLVDRVVQGGAHRAIGERVGQHRGRRCERARIAEDRPGSRLGPEGDYFR